MLAVNPVSFAQRKDDWTKVVQIFYKCVDYINDPATREDAIKIMAARAGADPDEYEKNVPGTHFLSLAEAKAAFKKGNGFDSIYGSMAIGNQFNLENKVYQGVTESFELPRAEYRRRPIRRRTAQGVAHRDWLGLKGELPERLRLALTILSFVVPLVVWSLVSYLPFLWHPLTRVTDPGGVEYFVEGMEVPNAEFAKQLEKMTRRAGADLPKGVRVNPVYLPAPTRRLAGILHRLYHTAAPSQRTLAS